MAIGRRKDGPNSFRVWTVWFQADYWPADRFNISRGDLSWLGVTLRRSSSWSPRLQPIRISRASKKMGINFLPTHSNSRQWTSSHSMSGPWAEPNQDQDLRPQDPPPHSTLEPTREELASSRWNSKPNPTKTPPIPIASTRPRFRTTCSTLSSPRSLILETIWSLPSCCCFFFFFLSKNYEAKRAGIAIRKERDYTRNLLPYLQ